ncbi:MAG: hypothetical protein E7651_04520 [Ruminococcaceae bacterium]|nr:hypothetical protein [Oscillospiraceae bacterium]
MIVLEIIGGILLFLLGLVLLLLALLCSLKLSLQAGYCEDLLLKVGIGPVTLNLSESMQMSREEADAYTKKKKKKKTGTKPGKAAKKKEKPLKYTEKPALTEIITAFKDLAVGILTRFARHIKLEELRLRVLAASDDAAKTALEYGSLCAAAGMVQTAAEALPRTNPKKVYIAVECDFLADKPEVDAEIRVSIRIWRLVWMALFAAKPLMEALELLKAYKHFKKLEKEEKDSEKEIK